MNGEVLWIVTVERRTIGSERDDASVRAQKALSPRLAQRHRGAGLEEQLAVASRVAFRQVLKHTAEAT